MSLISSLKNRLVRIHREEEGMEALQTVLIMAIAAIILAFAYKVFGGGGDNQTTTEGSQTTVAGWVVNVVNNLVKWK